MLALAVVPAISVAVRKFGQFLRELSHKTQAAAAIAASIAEVCLCHRKNNIESSYIGNYMFNNYKFQFLNHICDMIKPWGGLFEDFL